MSELHSFVKQSIEEYKRLEKNNRILNGMIKKKQKELDKEKTRVDVEIKELKCPLEKLWEEFNSLRGEKMETTYRLDAIRETLTYYDFDIDEHLDNEEEA